MNKEAMKISASTVNFQIDDGINDQNDVERVGRQMVKKQLRLLRQQSLKMKKLLQVQRKEAAQPCNSAINRTDSSSTTDCHSYIQPEPTYGEVDEEWWERHRLIRCDAFCMDPPPNGACNNGELPKNYCMDLAETMKNIVAKGMQTEMGSPGAGSGYPGSAGGAGYVTEKMYMLLQLYLQNKGWNPSIELLQCFTELKEASMLPSGAYLQMMASRVALDAQGRLVLRENENDVKKLAKMMQKEFKMVRRQILKIKKLMKAQGKKTTQPCSPTVNCTDSALISDCHCDIQPTYGDEFDEEWRENHRLIRYDAFCIDHPPSFCKLDDFL